MLDYLKRGEEYSEQGLPQVHGRESFRANELYSQMADWEMKFVSTPGKARTPVTEGDEIEITRRLFDKYSRLAEEYYSEDIGADKIKNENKFENLGEK